jgi:hypothetical protein
MSTAWIERVFAAAAFSLCFFLLSAAAAAASECNKVCKMSFVSCKDMSKSAHSTCRDGCLTLPAGEERGTCMADCASTLVEGVGGILECRDTMAMCVQECIAAPIACRQDCLSVAMSCRSDALADGSSCRRSCSAEAEAAKQACLEAGGEEADCKDAAGEARAACKDNCGRLKSMDLDACGSSFETCVSQCAPPDADETPGDDDPQDPPDPE